MYCLLVPNTHFDGHMFCLQTDDDEFEHFTDEDEFEGFSSDSARPIKGKPHEVPDLKIAKVSS